MVGESLCTVYDVCVKLDKTREFFSGYCVPILCDILIIIIIIIVILLIYIIGILGGRSGVCLERQIILL